ncbi:heterokaryon incompatibility protein-domain-containing protein [Aspergillus ambiguus]|uniref:HET domain-containing protein n=1 Tax=Aspergillus ambiguus TaxID=176160 RepID=UPI003CCD8550
MHSNSDVAFRRVEAWLELCRTTHDSCSPPERDPELPNRVVDVGSTGAQVAVIESQGRTGKYIALSHSWGSSPRITASKATLKDLKDGIAVSFLPKTFQDTIHVARRLGVRYIWIDCLCIIQDDSEDWEKEAAQMDRIYRNSYVTVSASASYDSHSGCFPKRQRDSYISPATRSLGYNILREGMGPASVMIEYEHPSQPRNRNIVHLFDEWLPGSRYRAPQKMNIGSFGKWFDPIADEPLSSRGWTLQERVLSPRIIHYAADQMYFECDYTLLSEDGFEFLNGSCFSLARCVDTQRISFDEHGLQNTSMSTVPGVNAETGGHRWTHGWLALIQNYSKRSLSVSKDKLSAVAGVAKVIAEETGDDYLAGAWAAHLPEDIYWRVYAQEEYFEVESGLPVKGKILGDVSRPVEYRAPSWSWASIDAPIKYIPLSYKNLVCRFRNCVTYPIGADNYGRVANGRIDIEGPLYEVKTYRSKVAWPRHGVPATIDLEDERGKWNMAIYFDFPGEPIQFPCYALFLDKGNAIIVRSKQLECYRDDRGNIHPERMVPKPIFCTGDLIPKMRKTPEGSTIVWLPSDKGSEDPIGRHRAVQITDETYFKLQHEIGGGHSLVNETNHVVRIGVGTLVARSGRSWTGEEREVDDCDIGEAVDYDPKVHDLRDMQIVTGDSWGCITEADARVPVTIF